MSARNLLLLLVIFMAQHQDMGVSSPIHSSCSRNCQWNEFKHLTQTLYTQALKIYNSTKSTDNVVLDNVPRIQCNDHCAPEHLISHKQTCLNRIFDILSYYKSALSTLSPSRENKDFTMVKKTISDILCLLQACDAKAINPETPKLVTEEFLRRHIGSPLLSVSILIARVFSPGDPANHIIHPKH
ncbi:interleukin-23 subunit alpha [Eleutherodactylus coqui]|uniref:interleukin-23 subunit alpha n=1 Tax=Eleutherodactylus coqui TaxID=57060 RepID=UPI0034620A54